MYGRIRGMEERKQTYTLITGACGGLGRAFVDSCAADGNLFLTGRSEERLRALREETERAHPGVRVAVFACDLTDESGRAALYAFLEEGGYVFHRLCNVAGADIQKAFEKYTEEKITLQCRINFEAAVSVTRAVLSHRAEALEIVTVSSISGAYPMPYFAIYSAAKSALASFSSALRLELKKEGVKVTCVMPGGIPTRPDIVENIRGQGLWGKLSAKPPAFVAGKSLKAVRKNRRLCIPGFWNRFIYTVPRILPLSLRMKFIARRWSKIEKDAF